MVFAPATTTTNATALSANARAFAPSTLATVRAIRDALTRAANAKGATSRGGTEMVLANSGAVSSNTASSSTMSGGDEETARVKALFAALLTARRVKSDAEASEVAPGVFVGGVGAAKNRDGLLAHGVTHVLTVCNGISAFYEDDFTYGYARVEDNTSADIAAHFEYCYAFIVDALASGGCVFVHCFQGKSRSVAVCAMYLMRSEGLSAEDALARVRAVRHVAAPNSGFVAALKALEARSSTRDESEDDIEASPKKKTKRASADVSASES
jgi:hypothetical protein